MTKEEYEKINEYIKDNIDRLYKPNFFAVRNSFTLFYLYKDFLTVRPKEKIRINDEWQKIDFLSNVNYANSFLKQYNLDNKLNELLNNGTIDIIDIKESYEDDYKDIDYYCNQSGENKAEIVSSHYGTIEDSRTLIHEFFHYLNLAPKITESRYILTEFVSIYFEFKYIEYLKDLNFDKHDLLKCYEMRFKDSYKICKEKNIMMLLIGIYDRYNDINQKNILEFDNILNINLIEKDISKLDLNKNLNLNNYRYVLGTLLATYALNNNIDPLNIIRLSNKLNDDSSVFELLEEIEIPLDNDILIKNAQSYLDKMINELTKEKSK